MRNDSLDTALTEATPLVSRRGVLVAASLAGLLIYLAVYGLLWPEAPVATPDSSDYIDLAERLVHGTWDGPHDRMLGYPLLLIPFGGTTQSIGRSLFYFQLLAHAAGVWALAAALRRLGASIPLCVGFVVLFMLPPFVDEAGMILTECMTGVMIAGMIYALVRWQIERSIAFLWLAGGLAGAAFLFRPVYLLFGAATAAAWFFTGRPKAMLRAAVPLIVPSVAILCTIIAVQYARFGYLGLTPKSGFMLFTRTLNVLERIPDEQAEIREVLIRHRDRSMTERGSSHTGVTFMWGASGALSEILAMTGKSSIELSSEMSKLNVDLIKRAPLEYLSVVTRDIIGSFFPSAMPLSLFGSRAMLFAWGGLHFLLIAAYLIVFCYFVADWTMTIVSGASLAPSTSLHPATRRTEIVLHLSVWYTAVLSAAVEVGQPRYMRPVMPLAVMAIVLFISRWKDWRRQTVVTVR